jgi:tRNA G18 (ribose-2'-O)-methylase SpoU
MLILLTGFKPLSTPMLTRKELLLQHTNRNNIIMRKLKITELNRISIEEFKEADKLPLVVVLDDIRSLHNIGSVFRTADAFRIECIYLCGITATPPHPEMHKTALGAEFTVDWKYVNNAVETVDNLRSEGYVVYSVEQAEGSIMLDELTLDRSKKYAVVMGNEVKGVQQEVIDHSDGCIEIPQYGTKHSLNVSVTAGIVIWDLFKKLK